MTDLYDRIHGEYAAARASGDDAATELASSRLRTFLLAGNPNGTTWAERADYSRLAHYEYEYQELMRPSTWRPARTEAQMDATPLGHDRRVANAEIALRKARRDDLIEELTQAT